MAKRDNTYIARLREAVIYDPETGQMWWSDRAPEWLHKKAKTAWPTKMAGRVAFPFVDNYGYRLGTFCRQKIKGHQAAWAIFYGEWPDAIDHIDGNRANNAINNLRLATQKQNCWNRSRYKNSTSPFIGIHRGRPMRSGATRWIAKINVNGQQYQLGSFKREEDAAKAFDAANWARAGQFARLNFPEVQHDEAKAGDWDGFINEFRRMRQSKSAAA